MWLLVSAEGGRDPRSSSLWKSASVLLIRDAGLRTVLFDDSWGSTKLLSCFIPVIIGVLRPP